jgi:hypothetical protein
MSYYKEIIYPPPYGTLYFPDQETLTAFQEDPQSVSYSQLPGGKEVKIIPVEPVTDKVNLADVQNDPNNFSKVTETNPPVLPNTVSKSATTTPSISRGIVKGTMIHKMNNDLVHVCDFAMEMKKNGALKRFLIAQFAEIQKGIRNVLRLLGVSDVSGTFSSTAAWLRGLATEILDFKRRVLDPILEFEKEVIGFVAWAYGMIAYIKSLPARLYALLESCLLKILNAVASILTDAFATVPNPFTEVAQAVKEVAAAVAVTAKEVVVIAATGRAAVQLTGQLLPAGVQSTISTAQGTASTANTSLSNASTKNNQSVPSSLTLVSQPLTASTFAAANVAATFLTSTIPSSSNVATQNTQSNESKKSAP